MFEVCTLYLGKNSKQGWLVLKKECVEHLLDGNPGGKDRKIPIIVEEGSGFLLITVSKKDDHSQVG